MPFDTKRHGNNLHPSDKSGQPHKEPASGRKEELSTEKFCSTTPTVHWVSDGWTCMSWEGGDGQPGGYTVTNGQSAMFFDETGNMVFSTGVPGQSGCGGKLILNTGDQLQKANGTISIQATGAKDTEATPGKGGKTKSKESPAYSVYAEGGMNLEAQGDDCGIKGDNIIINAVKTLTLKAGELINLEVGNGSGKINMYAGDITMDAEFLNKNINGREVSDGTGEVTTEQNKPGATTSINTSGSIVHDVQGNYTIKSKGHYNIVTAANINMQSQLGGYSLKTLGPMYNNITGFKVDDIKGVPMPNVKTKAPATWDVKLGPTLGGQGWLMKSAMGFDLKFLKGDSSIKTAGVLDVTVAGTMTVKALSIFLN